MRIRSSATYASKPSGRRSPPVIPSPDSENPAADEGEGAPPATWVRKGNLLDGEYSFINCTWQHVCVSAAAENFVLGSKNTPDNLTQLVGFLVEEELVKTAKILATDLRKWCAKNKVGTVRNATKKVVCDMIVKFHVQQKQRSISGEIVVTKEGISVHLKINEKRYLNVVWGEVMKGKLCSRGKALQVGQLNNNKKPHQKYCEDLIFEYNRSGVCEYDGNAHPELEWDVDASEF